MCGSAVREIVFCSNVFTVTPHERDGVPNHRPCDNLLNSMSWLRAKENLIGDVISCNTEIAYYGIVITVTQHEHHGVPYPQSPNSLFNMSWLIAKETSALSHWWRNYLIFNTETALCSIVITVTPHDRHAVSNHWPLDFLFSSLSCRRDNLSHNLVIVHERLYHVFAKYVFVNISLILISWLTIRIIGMTNIWNDEHLEWRTFGTVTATGNQWRDTIIYQINLKY